MAMNLRPHCAACSPVVVELRGTHSRIVAATQRNVPVETSTSHTIVEFLISSSFAHRLLSDPVWREIRTSLPPDDRTMRRGRYRAQVHSVSTAAAERTEGGRM
jgi:hypothetical protein